MSTDLRDTIERLATENGHDALDAAVDKVRETRFGQSAEGRAVIAAVDTLAEKYGMAAVKWVIRRIDARLDAKVERRRLATKEALDRAEARNLERIRAGEKGDGHQ